MNKNKTPCDYDRVATAIEFINSNIEQQPTLNQIAKQIHLSPAHFQRLFKRWAGVSPKRFLQFATLIRAQGLLDTAHTTLQTSAALGLSSQARLHDHFISLIAMTPGEYKRGGAELHIRYGEHITPFGQTFIAMTHRGICKMAFIDGKNDALDQLKIQWPNATLIAAQEDTKIILNQIFESQDKKYDLTLHLQGTNFQINVWRALLDIPNGKVTAYGELARQIGKPNAARAVGHAVALNPVAYLIPCHRVIRSTGALGGYRWGERRKQIMLLKEAL